MTSPRTTKVLASTDYYVTLTGAINPASENGGIGPSVMTVSVTETTVTETGQVFAPLCVVSFDGKYQYSGFAGHGDADEHPFSNPCAIVHCAV